MARMRAGIFWLASLTVLIGSASAAYTFGTFAGAELANTDGTGSDARFGGPRSVAVDRLGNIYVSDNANFTVRKVTPAGVVTTLAGSPGNPGTANGTGSAARFSRLQALTVDANDNVYVISGSAVRKITPDGTVSTIAGRDDEPGSINGDNSVARLNSPQGIARDVAGNIYVLEPDPGRIRKIGTDGSVTTYAGEMSYPLDQDGPIAVATFYQPSSLAIDLNGNLYVSNAFKIRKITPAGEASTLAGASLTVGDEDATGPNARFNFVRDLTADSNGNVYLVEDIVVRKVTSEGVVTTLAGTIYAFGTSDGTGPAARFMSLSGITINTSGVIYVSDYAGTIRAISTANAVTTLAGSPGRHRDGPAATALFGDPQAIVRDAQGNTFIADRGNHTIRKINASGIVTTLAGNPGLPGREDGPGTTARFNQPSGIAIESSGALLVTDAGNYTIRRIGVDGRVSTFAGKPGFQGFDDGPASEATFGTVYGIAIDQQGNVYVTEPYARTVRRITPAGLVTTIAGASGVNRPNDGLGTAAHFVAPLGIAVRADGSLVVADRGGTIRTIATNGLVQTLAGLLDPPGGTTSVDGTGSAARFDYPDGVVVSGAGDIFVTERSSSRIRKVSSAGVATTEFTASDAGWPSGSWAGLSVDASGRFFIADGIAGVIRTAAPDPPAPPEPVKESHLTNISTRGYCSTGDRVMIGGFVVSGSSPKKVLVRAVGPTLTSQGIGQSEVLLDPTIEVYKGSGVIASNDNWGDNVNAAEITSTTQQIGAGSLAMTDTKSAALLLTLQPGVYTFIASGKSNSSGIVLLEVYDADSSTSDTRFVNISTRAYSTTGNGVTIGGLVISGNAPKQILLRAVGPTLTKFGIGQADLLSDPTMELHDALHGNVTIATNDNWGDNANAAAITSTAARIGASAFDAGDAKSSALLMTLQPGVYTFIAAGKSSSSGIVLVEVYDAD